MSESEDTQGQQNMPPSPTSDQHDEQEQQVIEAQYDVFGTQYQIIIER